MSLSLLSRMKSKTGKDIDMDLGFDKDGLKMESAHLIQLFSPFVREGRMEHFKENMDKIFRKAIKFMVTMTRSRAIFVLVGKGLGQEYDPSTMQFQLTDSLDLDQRFLVDFFVSPALRKIGTADGRKFDRNFILCKAGVVIRRNNTTPPSSTEKSTEKSIKTES
ncbi:hypothetical protein XA68_10754 [Ophiocordyceps unilateralis]|uniref:Uncharacterized protein n=1 Tax=Ophiocordyceps unilateralis TaxID=268505 RepID=A0A2A9P152_OPHUN|nr:hypothetical protein XA68_10754 [Ophiocordyceps unilateralis]